MEKGRIITICRDDLLKNCDKNYCRLACIIINKSPARRRYYNQ